MKKYGLFFGSEGIFGNFLVLAVFCIYARRSVFCHAFESNSSVSNEKGAGNYSRHKRRGRGAEGESFDNSILNGRLFYGSVYS